MALLENIEFCLPKGSSLFLDCDLIFTYLCCYHEISLLLVLSGESIKRVIWWIPPTPILSEVLSAVHQGLKILNGKLQKYTICKFFNSTCLRYKHFTVSLFIFFSIPFPPYPPNCSNSLPPPFHSCCYC